MLGTLITPQSHERLVSARELLVGREIYVLDGGERERERWGPEAYGAVRGPTTPHPIDSQSQIHRPGLIIS